MKNHLIRAATLRLAAFTVAITLAQSVVSIPTAAKGKTLTKAELDHLIATAETKADHERVAQYFDAEAAKYEADAKKHKELAQAYRKSGTASATKYPGSMQTSNHCDSLSKSLAEAAEDARQLAADHRAIAKEAAK